MRATSSIAIFAIATACADDPVEWSATRYAGTPPPPAPTTSIVEVPGIRPCALSVRTVRMGSAALAAWWDVRPDSSASLMVAKSPEPAAGWQAAVEVDSSDRSRRGCGRPPPAVTSDPAKGYVYLSYYAEPVSGDGIFFVHSMDNAATFHAPFPILFGENPARVAIAATGDRVVVAYEDPNSVQPRIGVALSRTEGHLFEERTAASSDNSRAKQPIVVLAADTIRVWWSEYSANPSVSATRPAYREGIWK